MSESSIFNEEEQELYDSLKVPTWDVGQREQLIYNLRTSKRMEILDIELHQPDDDIS